MSTKAFDFADFDQHDPDGAHVINTCCDLRDETPGRPSLLMRDAGRTRYLLGSLGEHYVRWLRRTGRIA